MLTSFKLVHYDLVGVHGVFIVVESQFFRCILKFESTINLYNIYYY